MNKNNHNGHQATQVRKDKFVKSMKRLITQLKMLGKSKKEIILAMVNSGAKVRQARLIYKSHKQ